MKKAIAVLGLFFVCILPAQAVQMLSFVTQPAAENMGLSFSIQNLTYVVQNNTPVALSFTTKVTPSNAIVSEQLTNTCSNVVPANGQCSINLKIQTTNTAGNTGIVNQNLVITYSPRNEQLVAPVQFVVSGGLTFLSQPKPQDMTTNSTQTVTYILQNNDPNNALSINNAFVSPTSPLVSTQFTNSCSDSVPAGGTCNLSLTYTSNNAGGVVNQTTNVQFGLINADLVSSAFTFNIAGSDRVFNLSNECPFDIWLALGGGSATSIAGFEGGDLKDVSCVTSADCYPGTTCDPSTLQCFWINPTPDSGTLKLNPIGNAGSTTTLGFPVVAGNPLSLTWSGTITGRLDCDATSCGVADCGNGEGACPVGVGSTPPATLAEFTLNKSPNSDFFDITVINGVSIPIQMAPHNIPVSATNPYTCGIAGSITSVSAGGNTIGACSWEYTPPSNLYKKVAQGGAACTMDSDCAGSDECGLSVPSIVGGGVTTLSSATSLTCGAFEGYWSANQICSLNNNVDVLDAPTYDCSQNVGLAAPLDGYTVTDLYGCAPITAGANKEAIDSCYDTSAQNEFCCGCTNWQQQGLTIPTDPTIVPQCNPPALTFWRNTLLPNLDWMKQGCVSSYTYAFDDVGATYTCSDFDSNSNNIAQYDVTFCPGGKTAGF